MNLIKKAPLTIFIGIFLLVVLFSAQSVSAGTLTDFSYTPGSTDRAATTDYVFSYTIESADPNMIFYASFPFGFNLDGTSADVTINGSPATVSEFSAISNLMYVRLSPVDVASSSDVIVTIHNVVNPLVPGIYTFDFFRTAEGSGAALDTPASIDSITIVGESAGPFSGAGSGTPLDPYQITNCSQLQEMNANLHSEYILTQDIDCTESATWNVNLDEWVDGDTDNPLIPDSYASTTNSDINVVNNGYFGFDPVGSPDIPFTGSLDGDGYTISDLWIFRKEQQNIGLFGKTLSADISDVGLSDSNIVGQYSTGGIIGSMEGGVANDITLENNMVRAYLSYQGGGFAGEMIEGAEADNITNTGGTVHGSGSVIGGIVGKMDSSSVSNSHSLADVDGGDNIGGFVGSMYSSSINDSYATGSVHSDRLEYPFVKSGNYVGGFAGYVDGGSISDSYATGNVEAVGNYVGGFAGRINSYSEIENAYATGNVTGIQETIGETTYNYPYSVGGFAGEIYDSYIQYAYATGDVVNGGDATGGFSGSSGCSSEISYSYALGNVSGGDFTGGFTGDDGCEGPGTTFDQVFAVGDVSGDERVGGFAGRLNISTIGNAYTSGTVTGNSYIGGFAGELYYTDTNNVYSRGAVVSSGEEYVGAFVGKNFNDGEAIEGFWDNSVVYSFSGCGTGEEAECIGVEDKNAIEMTTQSTFEDAGYNFENIWVMNESNNGYPYFYFASEPMVLSVTPDADAINVNIDTEITAEFSQSMNTESSLIITSGPCGESCPSFDESWINMGTTLVLTKNNGPFEYGTTYTISIDGVETEGSIAVDSFEWSFTTEEDPNAAPEESNRGRSGSRKKTSSQTTPTSTPVENICTVISFIQPIRFGATNNPIDVKKLEQFLNTYEGTILPVDGIYSQADYDAVVKWQEKYATDILAPWGETKGTGYVFTTSLKKMNEIASKACSTTSTQSPISTSTPIDTQNITRDLKLDMVGVDVTILQQFLISKGYSIPAGATGFFGVQTQIALIKFQQDNNIVPARGYFGPVTRGFIQTI